MVSARCMICGRDVEAGFAAMVDHLLVVHDWSIDLDVVVER